MVYVKVLRRDTSIDSQEILISSKETNEILLMKFLLVFTEIELLYNVVFVSIIQKTESAIYVCIYIYTHVFIYIYTDIHKYISVYINT